jgi:hypothetical protein
MSTTLPPRPIPLDALEPHISPLTWSGRQETTRKLVTIQNGKNTA